jgi:hypothetical protein
MTATARSLRASTLLTGIVCVLLALAWLAPEAQGGEPHTLSHLPVSGYSVRPVCPPAAPGYASCAALELVPETPAARLPSDRLPVTRNAPASSDAAGECEPPVAFEGCKGLRPQDLHSAYALPTNSPSAQTIALVDAYDDPTAEHDLKTYDEYFGLPACTGATGCFEKVNQDGKRKPLPEANGKAAFEISIDIEVAHAVCQNCHILLVEAESLKNSNLETAEDRAVTLGATEISNSWDTNEPVTDSPAFDHPGIVITAAAGDYGYLNWDFSGEPEPEEIERGSVNYPASSPHVVAVGGTRLELSGPLDASQRNRENETVWNGYGATGSGCSAFPAPQWQLETSDWASVGCGAKRAVADVAADADIYTGVAVYDSTPEGKAPPGWATANGTSLASPLIAAVFALAGGSGGVEYPAKTLYENEASLYDVDSGSDGECTKRPTSEGLSGCTVGEEGAKCAGEAICVARTGYDGPSGVGTPDGLGAFEPTGEPGKAAQTIEFTSSPPPKPTAGAGPYAVAADASSLLLPVLFTSSTPFVCTVTGSTVSLIGAGTCTIDADQAGDRAYKAAPQARQSFVVDKGSQTIEFTSDAPASATVGGPAYAVAATASSELEVSLASETPEVCALAGSTVSFLATGTCTIAAEQAGDANYKAAPPARQVFAVGRKTQVIEFTSEAPASASVGGGAYAVAATASSGLAVSFSSATPGVCTLTGSTVSFAATGTCTIEAEQPGDAEYDEASAAEQTFAVYPAPIQAPAPAPVQPLASVSILPFMSSLPPQPTLAADSSFSLLRKPAVERRSGAISFTATVTNPGVLSWRLTFANGRFGAFQASATPCAAGRITLTGRCRPANVIFASGAIAVGAAGSVSFTVEPSASARKALETAVLRRRGLPVSATLRFQSALGAPAVSHTRLITDAPTEIGRHRTS